MPVISGLDSMWRGLLVVRALPDAYAMLRQPCLNTASKQSTSLQSTYYKAGELHGLRLPQGVTEFYQGARARAQNGAQSRTPVSEYEYT